MSNNLILRDSWAKELRTRGRPQIADLLLNPKFFATEESIFGIKGSITAFDDLKFQTWLSTGVSTCVEVGATLATKDQKIFIQSSLKMSAEIKIKPDFAKRVGTLVSTSQREIYPYNDEANGFVIRPVFTNTTSADDLISNVVVLIKSIEEALSYVRNLNTWRNQFIKGFGTSDSVYNFTNSLIATPDIGRGFRLLESHALSDDELRIKLIEYCEPHS